MGGRPRAGRGPLRRGHDRVRRLGRRPRAGTPPWPPRCDSGRGCRVAGGPGLTGPGSAVRGLVGYGHDADRRQPAEYEGQPHGAQLVGDGENAEPAGTGQGEQALPARADVVDREAGVIEVNATVVRLTGKGTVMQERPKSEAGWRVIAVPRRTIALCERRMGMSWPGADRRITVITADGEEVQRTVGELGILFPGLSGGLRSPSNANRDIKRVLDRIDEEAFGWVTTHTWRKTVATRLDDAGLSPRKIADHLGHSKPSMTQDVYMGRGVASAEAAEILA
ncbi:MAG: tyrosine-type recombinase/integrase [Streptosporangiales bacterium]|nr:tyrosine-type recombinase/integrase [Streptosporangiales bacterium]